MKNDADNSENILLDYRTVHTNDEVDFTRLLFGGIALFTLLFATGLFIIFVVVCFYKLTFSAGF